ncbi:MAG: glutaredoxin [Cyanobacteria bacterium SIG30]|nr:glutaredoxin [Cyanobacteria bacterium SIG30]
MYTVDYCPYCKAALEFLNNHNVKYKQIKIDDDEDNKRIELGQLLNIKGDVTVPQIILNGKHIGGFTDMIRKFEKGELKFD